MLIVCDNCGAEYQVDLGEGPENRKPQRFRCSACGHTFTISGEGETPARGPSTDPLRAPELDTGMFLQQEGRVYQVEDLATLQRWIVERRVLRDDMLSIGGLKWEPVGSRRELQVFFHLVEHAERAELSEAGAQGPPLSDTGGARPLDGAAPWEEGTEEVARPGRGSAEQDTEGLAAPEADEDEDVHDDGTDAGLPVMDLAGLSPALQAGPLDLPEPGPTFGGTLPNLAAVERAGGPIPAPGPAVPSDLLFPDEQGPRAPEPRWDDEPPVRTGTPGWVWAAVALALVGLGAWAWKSGLLDDAPTAPTPAGPSTAAPPPSASSPEPTPTPTGSSASPEPNRPAPTAPASSGTPAAPASSGTPAAPASSGTPAAPTPSGTPAAPTPSGTPAASTPTSSSTPAASTPASTSTPAASNPVSVSNPAAASPATTPVSPRKLVQQGWAAVDKGRFSEAQGLFSQALEHSPGNGDATFGLGYSYEKLGETSLAVRHYCRASRSASGDARLEAEGRLRALGAACE